MTTQNQLDRFREAANEATPPASTVMFEMIALIEGMDSAHAMPDGLLTAEDARHEVMSHDEWQYADREATWRWVFERGRLSAAQKPPAGMQLVPVETVGVLMRCECDIGNLLETSEGLLPEEREYIADLHKQIIGALKAARGES
jgi:hypothetical protein